MEGNVSISPINRQFIASQGIIKGVGSKLSNRKKSNKEMKQQPKPKMVKGEMGGTYTLSNMNKMKTEFAKSLQGQKDYTAKFQKMTPAQKAVEKKKFDASYNKLKKENAALKANSSSSNKLVPDFRKSVKNILIRQTPSKKK